MISSLELARLCGVSQGTVDRALHGRPGISASTRQRVLARAAEHGYQPNPAARELMTGTSRLVGALVPALNSVFFMDLMNAVREALAGEGLRLLLSPVASVAEFHEMLAECAARRMRAAIVVPPEEGLAMPERIGSGLPLISLLSPLRTAGRHHFLAPDEAETGRTAVRGLAALGHRRILHLSYERRAHAIVERERGFAEAMRELSPDSDAAIVHGCERDQLAEALARWRPTAIFCHNDWLALQALRELAALGRRVPQDVSVLGVDRSPTFMQLQPDLASLAYPRAAIGARAAAWIMGRTAPSGALRCTWEPGATVIARRD